MTISSLFLFLLASEVKFHSTNIKKIPTVSIYSLKPVYTFLYTIINDNVLASFVQKKKKGFEIWRSKKQSFLLTYATLKPPHPLYAIVRIWVDPSPSPLCVRTMWINNNLLITKIRNSWIYHKIKKCFFLKQVNRSTCHLNTNWNKATRLLELERLLRHSHMSSKQTGLVVIKGPLQPSRNKTWFQFFSIGK